MYAVPDEYFFRIHHVRPRFKNDVESVLLYVAQECTRLSDLPVRDYAELLNRAIRLYGGNSSLADKTINNLIDIVPVNGIVHRNIPIVVV